MKRSVGRPSLGTTKKVSITLPNEIWQRIESEGNRSEWLRNLILKHFEQMGGMDNDNQI